MIRPERTSALLTPLLLAALALGAPLLARGGEDERGEAFAAAVDAYRGHVDTLAHEMMGGRLPGTAGMEMAKAYMEFHYRRVGLEAPFDQVLRDEDGAERLRIRRASYRQPFELAGTSRLVSQEFEVLGEGPLEPEVEFQMLSLGGSGDVTAPVVFVGYSIERGRDDYEGYAEGDDLTGKIALMLRFEPMDEAGKSLWGGSPWTARASFSGKVRAAAERGAAGVVILQTPGAADERVESLTAFRSGGGRRLDGPVAMVALEAGERLVRSLGSDLSLLELRAEADRGRVFRELPGKLRLVADVERKPVLAENVGAVLPGRGELADELVVIGAHLDHLGMGDFASRAEPEERGRVLHPGADDNASGNAALILLAERLRADYEAMPEGAQARSILFLSFSAEESGLNGANHYVENPIADMARHQLMINFDMIGRITNNRLSVSGAGSGAGLPEFLAPYIERTPLEVVQPEGMSGGSDHLSFLRKEVPSLFGIIADFHDDYHTPRDTADKINHVDAVHTVELFHQIALGAATRPERFAYQSQQRGRRERPEPEAAAEEPAAEEEAPSRAAIRVRFGIQPASYSDSEPGVGVSAVTAGSSADLGGVKGGDRLVRWNGADIEDVRTWMGMLAAHEPGDEVRVTVDRGGAEVELTITLQGRDTDG